MTPRIAPSTITDMNTPATRRRLARSVLAALAALVLAAATPAAASVADEQGEGAALLRALGSGERDYGALSARDFERVGEYWMGRMLGSTRAHEAMNARMSRMMGASGEERMHELMGQRYARLASSGGGQPSRGADRGCGYGPGMMMGEDYHDGCADDRRWMMDGDHEWGPMMGTMMGSWRNMDRGDWQQMMDRFDAAGTGSAGSDGGSSGWDTREVALLGLALVLGALLVASLAVFRPWRRAAH